MKSWPFVKRIKAKDGCVLFFPKRRRNAIISGLQKTRRAWGEEWVQIQFDFVEVEARFEGDMALTLGDSFRAEVVVWLVARIKEENLQEALPKLIERFRCSSTADPSLILDGSYFKPKIRDLFFEEIYSSIRKGSFTKLLDDSSHKEELTQDLVGAVKSALNAAGFQVVQCAVKKLAPMDPGQAGVDPHIIDKWIELEAEQERLKAKKEKLELDLKDVQRREADERKQRKDAETRAIRLKDEEDEKEFKRKKAEIEKDEFRIQKEKEKEMADIAEEANEVNREYQRKEIAFKDGIKRQEIEEQNKRELELENHKAAIREKTIQGLKEEKEQYNLQKEIATTKAYVEKIEGMTEVEILAERIKAENAARREMAVIEEKKWGELLEALPEVLRNLPVQKVGESTVIHVSGDNGGENNLSSLGPIAYIPMVQKLITTLHTLAPTYFGVHGESKHDESVAQPGEFTSEASEGQRKMS